MAEVYRNVERVAARQAHRGTIMHAERLMLVAGRVLAQHRAHGHAYVAVTRGRRADAFVDLVDPGGNALAIELGRTGARGRGPSQGVYALHAAMGARDA
ncbi:hypothetical protein [Streptomonospora nanhaiensis]|uniref:hypothetical protein n=1 Tax=Streptomonospora nanhaiensis TaxID=1323731 RepID=UPI001C37FFDD|nr:hypothetical protein [Streptomonospora nanhaiensis]MBV2364265.1 hypothetical protein [Streptomonospora nanhaiensis]